MADLNIVAVDDDDITLEIITRILEEAFGAFVYAFSRSKQAREFLVRQTPDTLQLVISDQNMPEHDGLTLLKMCNNIQLNIPFILLTGDVSRETVMKARQLGVDGYIAKPIKRESLITKVKAVLDLTD